MLSPGARITASFEYVARGLSEPSPGRDRPRVHVTTTLGRSRGHWGLGFGFEGSGCQACVQDAKGQDVGLGDVRRDRGWANRR